MNPTGNNSNTLLAVEPSTMAATKKASPKVSSASNPLNNKEFSDVLNESQARDSTVVKRAPNGEAALRATAGQGGQRQNSAVSGLGNGQFGGNGLPGDGVSLPVTAEWLPSSDGDGTGFALGDFQVEVPTQWFDAGLAEDASALFNPYTATYTMAADGVVTGEMSVGQQATLDQIASALNVRLMDTRSTAPAAGDLPPGFTVSGLTNDGAVPTTASTRTMAAGDLNLGLTGVNADGTPVVASALNSSAQTRAQMSKADLIKFSLEGASTVDSQPSDNPLSVSSRPEALQPIRPGADAIAQTTIPVAVGKQGWNDAVTQKVMWMSSQQISKAEISLDPPELGSLHVRITTHGDQTSVSFTSSHAAVREVLDQNLPRLRDMMESQGLDLADVNVADQRAGQEQRQANDSGIANGSGYDAANEDGLDVQHDVPVQMAQLGLVDQYV